MLIIGPFRFTRQKILVGQHRAHAFWPPDVMVPKNHVLPILGWKKFEIQKFFFLQISLFIGPIDGINNIFFSEVL